MQKHNTIAGLISGLAAASIWGGMYVVSKVVLEVIPPFLLLAIRLVMGSAVLGAIVLLKKQKPNITREVFWKSFLVGIVGYGISLGFQFVGTKLSTASNGSLVTSATPAFVLIFAPFLLAERATPRGMIALLLSTLGVVAVIDPRTAELSPNLFWGNMSLLAAAVTWALYSVLVRKVSKSGDLLATSAIMLLGGLPSSILLGLQEASTQGVGEITAGILGGLLFLGIISTAIAMFLWNYAFAELPANIASLTFFAQPVVGTLLGWIFLSEQVTPMFLIGGALIAAGILIATSEQQENKNTSS